MLSLTQIWLVALLVPKMPSALAHMLLAKPPPIGHVNNSPLEGPNAVGGGNYPCKYTGDPSFYANAVRTTIPLGSNYTARFTGSAVHGGGSCQFSLSKDLAPTAASSFKVIYSIQGGCPARNTPGNLGNDASMADPFEYPFTMPPGLEPGQYTFAWTWINKVGNREFYMNCAAIDVTATEEHKGDPAYYDSLPDLTVVNINGVDCVSEDDNGKGSFQYQNPGQFVETNDALQYVKKQCFAPISGSKQNESTQKSSAGTDDETKASLTTTSVEAAGMFFTQTSPLQTQAASTASAPTGFTTILTTFPLSIAPSSTSTQPQFPVTTSISNSNPDHPSSSSYPACPPTWLTCTTVGFFCVDKTHFGLCSFGCMPQVQSLAEGVGCDLTTNTLYDLRVQQ